jgi:glycosyltransferase 2 family protein
VIATELSRPAPLPRPLAQAAARVRSGGWTGPARALAGLGGVALLLRSSDPAAVARELSAARPGWLLAALLTGCVSQLAAAVPWALLLPHHPELRWPRLARAFLRATFASQVLPTGVGGDALRTAEVGRVVGYGGALAALAGSRVLGLLAMALWAAAAGWLLAGSGGALLPVSSTAFLGVVLAAGVVAFGADHVVRRVPVGRAPQRLRRLLEEMATGLRSYRRRPGRLAAVLAVSLAVWGLNLVSMVLFTRSLGATVDWDVFAVAMPLTLAVTLLPITVNGLGVREGVLVGLLARAGVGTVTGAALAVFVDLQALPVALVGAGLCLGWGRARH